MATADGETNRGEVGRRPVLNKDFPWPANWEGVLGPGGEDLGDGIVELGVDDAPAEPVDRPRRGPRRRPGRRSAALAGIAAGLAGLATLLAVVLSSPDGSPPAQANRAVAVVSAPGEASSRVADSIASSVGLDTRVRETAQRLRAEARRKETLVRAQRQKRRAENPPVRSAPVATQVSAPARSTAPPVSPAPPAWSGVSAAEREFTPGPWNLD